ncbi:MAG: glycosyl transferase family 36, partial [Peptococcaceae bacterium]|nr:glycosyl transferase family 36 [Peptococcaceae bacterium]
DENRKLFSIGYAINDQARDKSFYDLLASEARQASFIAIAKGDIPQSHWFRLGRTLTGVKGNRSLASWSGTMFEFLMPLLLMRTYPGTLLDQTYHAVIRVQQLYGAQHNVPWGVSESGFFELDGLNNYQYRAFGVPGLGLKQNLAKDVVIAPYATFMALMVEPQAATENLRLMQAKGYAGTFGMFEAIDFTPERATVSGFGIVKSYMVHHQGMSFLALDNVLHDNIMQQRFHAHPMIQATELLLQERIPSENSAKGEIEERPNEPDRKTIDKMWARRFVTYGTADSLMPITHFLSNGQYSVMMTNAGSGYSRFGKNAVSRWREDVTRDAWGTYFYIKELNSETVWSATHQPCGNSGENYKVIYAPDRIEFSRRDNNIVTKTEISVSPEDQVEIRRISLTNHSLRDRILEITSYFEIVLAPMNEDMAHPAFGNLFVETEFAHQALLATRRKRKEDDVELWAMNTVVVDGEGIGAVQYETDRAKFIGRGRSLANPQALDSSQPLSNTVGAVIDPVMCLRQRVKLRPGQTVRVSFSTGIGNSRDEAVELALKYHNVGTVERAFELAWTYSQMELQHLNLSPAQANEALNFGANLLYLSPCRQEFATVIAQNRKGQSSLWPYAISGDFPIVLIRLADATQLDLVSQFLIVHEYLRIKGLLIDLVVLNEEHSGYLTTLQDSLRDIVSVGHARELVNKPGGVYLLYKDMVSPEDINLLSTVARVNFIGAEGSCSFQMRSKGKFFKVSPDSLDQMDDAGAEDEEGTKPWPEDRRLRISPSNLQYGNGIGGFSQDGSEYIIELKAKELTPLPWINVIANDDFGFIVSDSGSGYTWSQNSQANKLTPWSNDPVLDPLGEVCYLRDEQSGDFWSVTPKPVPSASGYTVRHGQGYSVFDHYSQGLAQSLLMFVPLSGTLKILELTLRNDTESERHLSSTYYMEPVLGVARDLTAPFIATEYDESRAAMLIRNTYQEEFAGRVVFLGATGGKVMSFTGDRTEFIGRNGSLENPAVMQRTELSSVTGAGFDPCAAIQLEINLQPGETRSICFLLGEGATRESALALLDAYQMPEQVQAAFEKVKSYWQELLGTVQVSTPDKSMDLLLNRWLLYQTASCRLKARSAFYQSGGAYGFRDQLQDVMALVFADPSLTRRQIILHCNHQFLEGDVQHWWHPEKNRGIRTKFSDDMLWLPFVTADYLEHTGDYSILDESASYLEEELLREDEAERYGLPTVSPQRGSVYEHCLRAIERAVHFGEHGLPLIGSGDWNDGFSNIGIKGKGESVWLGWFLYATLTRFAKICATRSDLETAKRFDEIAKELQSNLECHGWDGSWYRRAYFDDGTPLGSVRNEECQIDCIAQAWAVISGAGSRDKVRAAMLALDHYLLRRDDRMLLLLNPPFDHAEPNPGYIKGYVPGVRENGGQYTHGAIWAVLAWTMIGEGDQATELFQMLNPINHSRTESEVARYKVEPYVMAGDVYATPGHEGRGGWSWYTGASGWMYRTGLEGILGFSPTGDTLTIKPCIPRHWPGYSIEYRYKDTPYVIEVMNPNGKMTGVGQISVDGVVLNGDSIPLVNDTKPHLIKVLM